MLITDNFTFSIECSADIETSDVMVPALLIQPFVENAFKHGLRHKAGAKNLKINFSQIKEARLLKIEITDNGIGRKRAAEINAGATRKHSSFATAAAKERIEIINGSAAGVEAIVIEDLVDASQNSIGTRVTLSIVSPLKSLE
jgi:sensor histidine kinase YesM